MAYSKARRLADLASTSYGIADDKVTSATIADDAITSALIADDAITSALIADDAITSALIADDAITSALIADDAVVQAGIADDAVNEARLQISNTPTNGYVLSAQSGNTGGLTWAEAGGGAYSDWSVKTGTYTAVAKDQLIANSGSAFTITLPASPSAGNTVVIHNAGAGTLTIGRNSSNINSTADNGELTTDKSTQLVYVDGTIGWKEI